jgi:hypothetical protein
MALLALCSLGGSGAFAAAAPLPHIFLLYVDDWCVLPPTRAHASDTAGCWLLAHTR